MTDLPERTSKPAQQRGWLAPLARLFSALAAYCDPGLARPALPAAESEATGDALESTPESGAVSSLPLFQTDGSLGVATGGALGPASGYQPRSVPVEAPVEAARVDLDRVEHCVTSILGGARKASLGRVREVNRSTEVETLSVGRALEQIVVEARDQVVDARRALEQIAGSGSEHTVTGSIGRQAHTIGEYVSGIRSMIAAQSDATRSAEEASHQILDLGKRIGKVAFQSRLLSLNASIEAARLGAEGSAFSVIASEMARLNSEIEATNQLVSAFAESLRERVPRITEQSAQLQTYSEKFSSGLSAELEGIGAASKKLESTVAEVLARGDARIERIVAHSRDALSHLQFQDPCAQRLLSIDAVLAEAERRIAAMFAEPAGEPELGDFSEVKSHRAEYAGDVSAFSLRHGHEPGVEVAPTGDVVLF